MEHLDSDMDDLFRKAGDQYPLKITGSDWDGVLGKLRENIPGDATLLAGSATNETRKKRRWLLLLFIPLILGSVMYVSSVGHRSVPDIKISDKEKKSESAEPVHKAVVVPPFQTNVASNTINHRSSVVFKKTGKPDPYFYQKDPDGSTFGLNNSFDAESKPLSLAVDGRAENFQVSGKPLPVPAKEMISLSDSSSENLKKKNEEKSAGPKGFYIGFLAGPDISAVHFQSVKQMGFSLGILVGYRFNKRFSLETGLLWDKKYYYSSGEYFDKSKTTIHQAETIHNLNGYCNMFEIPVALRYDFATKINHGYFVKAGLSTYLMKKEEYNINAELYGNQISYPYSYDNSTKNIFSILQLSAGYEYSLSKKTKIRIEPYVKIPLQGVGIGSMPISSAGLYLGISHSFR